MLRPLACAVIAVALPAFAITTTAHSPVAQGTINADMPPERFRGPNVVVTVYTDRTGIEENCGKAQPGFVIIACTRATPKGQPVIFLPDPCFIGDTDWYAKIVCHEKAHSLGWTADHEL